MNSPVDCHDIRLDLGAYALDTLEPPDRSRVDAHLATCVTCRAELDELVTVAAALAKLDPADLTTPAPSPDLFARVVAATDTGSGVDADADNVTGGVGPRRPHGRRRWLLAVAASVAVLAGVGIAVEVATTSAPRPDVTVASGAARGVQLRVAASDVEGGTRLQLTVQGLPAHERCRLVAVASDGSVHDAGRWNATYDGEARVIESTDVDRDQLRQLTLYGRDNRELVRLDV